MRILFLAHRIPYPPNKGDKIRSFNLLSWLAGRHEVVLGTLVEDARDLAHVPHLENMLGTALVARIDTPMRRPLSVLAMLRSVPISVRYFHHDSLQSQIDALLDTADVDAVVCSSSPMAEYVFRSRHARRLFERANLVMDLIDVDSRKWDQYAAATPIWKSWVFRYEARALAAYERRIGRSFRNMVVVSEAERDVFPGGAPDNLHVICNGVDLQHFMPRARGDVAGEGPVLLFTGAMDYWPNVDGVRWFVEEVLPRIRAEAPDVVFQIVGSRPTPSVRKLAMVPGVQVMGFVDDVRDYIAGATVCVVPLRIARGVQNKVLEAMAMARATVITRQVRPGLRVTEDQDLLVAEDATEFAQSVLALLQDVERRRHVETSARRRVEASYDWSGNLARLQELGL